jgi:vesicle coat complex subunit
LVLKVLTWATKEADNPDLRDRGFMYWRLLSTNLSATKQIVLSEKRIGLESENRFAMEEYIGSLASVYHKSPQQFIRGNFKPRSLEPSPALRSSSSINVSETDRFVPSQLVRSTNICFRNGNHRIDDTDSNFSPISPVSANFGSRGGEDLVGVTVGEGEL